MFLGGKVDDEPRGCGPLHHVHTAGHDFSRFARAFVGREVFGKGLFELKGEAFAHYPLGINRIDERFDVGGK